MKRLVFLTVVWGRASRATRRMRIRQQLIQSCAHVDLVRARRGTHAELDWRVKPPILADKDNHGQAHPRRKLREHSLRRVAQDRKRELAALRVTLERVVRHFSFALDADPEELDRPAGVLTFQLFQCKQLGAAWSAPGRAERNQHYLATQISHVIGLTVETRQSDRGLGD